MNEQRGQTLVEMLLAIIIAAFLLVALTALILATFTNLNNNQNNSTALQFAQSGMEYIKNQEQLNPYFLNNSNNQGTTCLGSISSSDQSGATDGLQLCTSSSNPPYLLQDSLGQQYLRQVTVTPNGGSCTSSAPYQNYLVDVSVGWHDNKCSLSNTFCRITKLDTCISNINAIPTNGF